MKVEVKKPARKSLEKLQQKQRVKILNKIRRLPNHPTVGKKLEGEYKDLRSLRVWPYRVIYKLGKKKITIYSMAHRQSAYKRK